MTFRAMPSRDRGWILSLGIGIALAPAGCGGNSTTSPSQPYTMPLTQATVQSAVDLFTTGTDTVPVQCSGTVPIDCPGGSAGPVVTIALDRVSDSIFTFMPGQSYQYSTHVALTVSQDIPVTIPVIGACGLHVDVSQGASPTVHVSGEVTFRSSTLAGPLDELDLTAALDGLEAADVSLTGGGACALANESLSLYLGLLTTALGTPTEVLLCAGSGPGKFVTCPAPAAAARRVGGSGRLSVQMLPARWLPVDERGGAQVAGARPGTGAGG